MIPRHGKNEIVGQGFATRGRFHHDGVGRDLRDPRLKIGFDFAVLDAVFDVGLDPVLYVLLYSVAAINERDPRTVTPQFECRNGRGILASDHSYVRVVIRMGIVIVMVHLAQGFARNTHPVGQIVVANGENKLARLQFAVASKAICSLHRKIPIDPADPLHAMVLANIQLVIGSDLAIVFERLIPRRFGVGAGEGNAADFQQLGSGKERHVRGIVKDGVANAALVDQHHAKASLLCLDGGSQPGRPCSHYQEIEGSFLPRTFCCVAHVIRLGHATRMRYIQVAPAAGRWNEKAPANAGASDC